MFGIPSRCCGLLAPEMQALFFPNWKQMLATYETRWLGG